MAGTLLHHLIHTLQTEQVCRLQVRAVEILSHQTFVMHSCPAPHTLYTVHFQLTHNTSYTINL